MSVRAVATAITIVIAGAFIAACGRPSSSEDSRTPPAGNPLLFGWDGVSNRLIMSGILQTQYSDHSYNYDYTTWIFTGTKWIAADPTQAIPSVRGTWPLFFYDSSLKRDLLILLPAAGADSPKSTVVWEWDGKSWQQRQTTNEGPTNRTQHVMAAYSPELHAIVVLDTPGGETKWVSDIATWLFDGLTWRLVSTPHWSNFLGFGLAYDPMRHSIVAFDSRFVTWEFDGQDWSPISTSGLWPRPRQAAIIGFDELRSRWVVFGGDDGATNFTDTWTGDGATWSKESPKSSPIGRSAWVRPIMAWDPVHARPVMFGGTARWQNSRDLADTWSWDGANWTQIAGPTYEDVAPPPSPSRVASPSRP